LADVSELDPVARNGVRPVDIIGWKQTESDTYVSYGWPGKFGFWETWVNAYKTFFAHEKVRGEFRDARFVERLREGKDAQGGYGGGATGADKDDCLNSTLYRFES